MLFRSSQSHLRARITRILFFRATFVQGFAGTLPLVDNSLDFVLCLGVLHHLPDIEEGLYEALRVLRPRGYLALREPIEIHDRLDKLASRWRSHSGPSCMSPWERPIDAERLAESARKRATLIVNQKIYSRPGAFAVTLLNKIPFFSVSKNKTFWRLKVPVDEGIENTLGKRFSTFAGTSLFMLMQKN